MKRILPALILFLLALASPAWARPEKWKKTAPVTGETLDDALARAEAKVEAEYQGMELARVRAKAKAWGEYKAMEEARSKAAKPTPKLPH